MLSKKGNYEEYLQYAYRNNRLPEYNIIDFYESHRLRGTYEESDLKTIRAEHSFFLVEWAKERLGVYNVIRFWERGSRWRFKNKNVPC